MGMLHMLEIFSTLMLCKYEITIYLNSQEVLDVLRIHWEFLAIFNSF